MRTTVSCAAPYGGGGLGAHLAQVVETLRARNELARYFCLAPAPGDEDGEAVEPSWVWRASAFTPVRFSSGRRTHLAGELFDRAVAKRVGRSERHVGFSGQTLRTFAAAGGTCELVSPTAHVALVRESYDAAHRAHPIEGSWLNAAGVRKAIAEYGRADVIHVASEYAWSSFVRAGVPEQKLRRVELAVAGRFGPAEQEHSDGVFRAVYVGALTVAKGVPLLLDAFSMLSGDVELVLVGGWSSRGMRRFLEGRDRRVQIVGGDPLEQLRRADVLVHPSYSDGFGYAPMEALACGLPVVVTEDTGMKEHVEEGVNGFVVPTGDAGAIAERLEAIRGGAWSRSVGQAAEAAR